MEESLSKKLLYSLLEGGLESIGYTIYKLTNAPLVVVDYSGRCILQIPNDYIGDINWESYRSHSYTTPEENKKYQDYFKRSVQSGKSCIYINDASICQFPLLMGEYKQSEEVAGHFGMVITKDTMIENLFEIGEMFSSILSSPWASSNKIIPSYQKQQNFLLASLNKEKADVISIPGKYILINAFYKKENELFNESYFYCICDYINNIFVDTYAVIYLHQIIILVGNIQNNQSSKVNAIIQCLCNYKLISSISSTFSNLSRIYSIYKKNILTLEVGLHLNEEKNVYYYDAYVPLQLFWNEYQNHSTIELVHPLFLDLIQYDTENNAEYTLTFQTFILNGMDRKKTAKTLNIHYNTLVYRLEKMNELFSLYEYQETQLPYLMCSALLLKLDKKQQ